MTPFDPNELIASYREAGNIEWLPFETCPQVRATHWFKWADGNVAMGQLEEFWCGSDCPCYNLDEGPSGPMDCYPDCWGVRGHDADPLYWAPANALTGHASPASSPSRNSAQQEVGE
jgi:hypothetical protein